ncbi:hypothetical protein [Krasilnikoviella flava]|uniref:DUF4245 domain-containing protein n=1 Tax=Krasilnikoviella flava TaxID=526729 RepID=A0A1T5J5K2_9MICO|nr:hypothetical protein [Krasilnikoviella flava]SKC46626.1 hypothetical protein SAMN04324258_1055 [Krasilnikoviella flava]
MSQARTGGNGRPSPEVFRRRRLVVASAAGALVLLIVLLTAFAWPGFARDEPEPQATVTAPVPTPTIAPSGRPEDQTAFVKAQPDAVLALALREVAAYPTWEDDADAVEAWQLTYADGAGEGAASVVVLAGQWEDDDAATGAYEALAKAAGEPTDEGEVAVEGEATGAYVVTPGSTAGTAVVTWRNGTAVLQATGPADLVEDFYSAYPL